MRSARLFSRTPNRPYSQFAHHQLTRPLLAPNIFFRHGLTKSGPEELKPIQEVMDWVCNNYSVNMLLGKEAKGDAAFREEFEKRTGLAFTPENFRAYRVALLREQTDGYMFHWADNSFSGCFEVGVLATLRETQNKMIPLFFALHKPMKTTLLRELPNAYYAEYNKPEDLSSKFELFLSNVNRAMQVRQLGLDNISAFPALHK